MKKSA
jgi:hypothetical protein